MVKVKIAEEALSEKELSSITRLNGQLTSDTNSKLRLPPYDNAVLFLAEDDYVMGMLTLAFYDAPSGRKAWIEDFVVDSSCRGSGVGKMLMDSAIEYARKIAADKVYLTSRPSRRAAHVFYEKYGFTQRTTDVFVLPIQSL